MLDLRLPIGWFFIINSVLLVGVGVFQPTLVPFGDKNINLDLIWGCVMGVFGLFMAGLSYAERLRGATSASANPAAVHADGDQ